MMDHEPKNGNFWRMENPVVWGLLISLAIFAVIYWLGRQPSSVGINFDDFLKSTPNEMGGTLSGVFGSLAFVWIVVTVFMQSSEFREQRYEFEKMSKVLEAQATALMFQVKKIKVNDAFTDLVQSINSVIDLLNILSVKLTWTVIDKSRSQSEQIKIIQELEISMSKDERDHNFDLTRRGLTALRQGFMFLSSLDETTSISTKPTLPEEMKKLI